ncbi:hypothetical protein DFH11DRAFT_362920 [Phellopilus nigrolimitatus]|nr:hypothetical protein DFH11DRAFT_362920 [Phellopilus nigrolimitatus]
MPAEQQGSEYASGVLPLDEDEISRRGGKKVDLQSQAPPCKSQYQTPIPAHSRALGIPILHIRPLPPPAPRILGPEPYITFYFRSRPKELLRAHGIIRSRSLRLSPSPSPTRKRSRPPVISTCENSRVTSKPCKRSRSCPSDSGRSEGSTKVDFSTVPFAVLRGYSSVAKTGTEPITRADDSDGEENIKQEREDSMPRTLSGDDGLFQGVTVGVQTDPSSDAEQVDAEREETPDTDLDEQFAKVEQRLLETHAMLLQLKTKMKRRRQS